ncbi:glycoside hydrolase family 30 protein [Cloacibacterium sp. TD35]|uniref:glycoside hydrolase family 30 protein n=1 Tax=Cloacibacterium sp. TD35 TaxID=2976818 RepID=UPI00237DA4B8|nr:glycoside hydrolase family 30 beta sandwich domain-containing protein [Cloacibacterium sp. TD35]WDT68675.1 glucosylceramidase [Cloacibacterium sp. TD35]
MVLKKIIPALVLGSIASLISCNSFTKIEAPQTIEYWQTNADETLKLQKQNNLVFDNPQNNFQNILINPSEKFQTVDGFGYTLTGGSVEVINQLSPAKKKELLQDIFGKSEQSIGVSYLRLSIGASDLNSSVFSYDDVPAGQTDEDLSEFSLAKDQFVIDMLKEILAINPDIKIIGAPWSPPVWMKDNGNSIGGSLKTEYYQVYAEYFVKYIQEMKKNGITIDAITPQNEPLHPGNNPSMYMTAEQQRDFIKNNLGPAFRAANIATKIVLYDHNCDKPEYPITILQDPEAAQYVDGSAFHLYAGDVSALGTVKNAFPNKNLYFTEQWTGSTGTFAGDFIWHTKNVIIGTMRNWSKIALEWNLANDAQFQPFTPGGCTQCKGAITINSSESYTKNVAYYIIAHASKFVPQNSQRIGSTQVGNLSTLAFKTPEGKIALIVLNEGAEVENFNINFDGKSVAASLPSNSVATYTF